MIHTTLVVRAAYREQPGFSKFRSGQKRRRSLNKFRSRFPGSRQVSCVTPHAIQHGLWWHPSRNLAFRALKADFFGLPRHATGTPARPVRTHPDNPLVPQTARCFPGLPDRLPAEWRNRLRAAAVGVIAPALRSSPAAQRPNRLSAHTLNRLPVSCLLADQD